MCRVRPRGMLGGFDTNVVICVIKPKKCVCYEQKFLRQLLVMAQDQVISLRVLRLFHNN